MLESLPVCGNERRKSYPPSLQHTMEKTMVRPVSDVFLLEESEKNKLKRLIEMNPPSI